MGIISAVLIRTFWKIKFLATTDEGITDRPNFKKVDDKSVEVLRNFLHVTTVFSVARISPCTRHMLSMLEEVNSFFQHLYWTSFQDQQCKTLK